MSAEVANEAGQSEDSVGSHLVLAARGLLRRPTDERLAAIRSGSWITYPRAGQVLERLAYVLAQPTVPRMMGLTIHGPTNNGKTSLVHTFIAQQVDAEGGPDAERKEFLYVETPPLPNPAMLFSKILRTVGDPRAETGSMTQRLDRVLYVLPRVRPRMLFLDEIHNVLAGSGKQAEVFLNTLKHLANELRIPIVLIGTDDALRVIKTDPQVLNRFPAMELPQWNGGKDFGQLTKYLLSTLPLRKPTPLTPSLNDRLYQMSSGVIGGLVQLLQRAACYAVQHGVELIDARVLDAMDDAVAVRRVA